MRTYSYTKIFKSMSSDDPLPIPCKTKGCDMNPMEYNIIEGTYECDICGRIVSRFESKEYLYKMINGEDIPLDKISVVNVL